MSDPQPLEGLSQRLAPANLQAEMGLLGALLASSGNSFDRVAFLRPEHFADPVNGRIFHAIATHVTAGEKVDAILLKTEFENSGVLEAVGGTPYLASLMTAFPGLALAEPYAKAIYDAWTRRQMIDAGTAVVNEAFGGAPTAQTLDEAMERIGDINQARTPWQRPGGFAEALKSVVETSEATFKSTGVAALHTGIKAVDRVWPAMLPGELYFLMARSRTGKTSALAQFVRHIARTIDDGCVYVCSWEMSTEAFGLVNLVGEGEWTADQIRAGQIGDAAAWLRFNELSTTVGQLPIEVNDRRGTFGRLAAAARAVHRRRGIKLLAMDHMDLVMRAEGQRFMQLNEWVPFVGYQFKELAKELEVPVVVLRQINKSRDTEEPTLNDLPFDGGQAADEAYALYRKEIDMGVEPPGLAAIKDTEKRANAMSDWLRQKREAAGVAKFYAVKRRFGPMLSAELTFHGPSMSLREPEPLFAQEEMPMDNYTRGESSW